MEKARHVSGKELHYLEYLNRENAFRHHSYDEDMLQYEYLKMGDPKALREAKRMFVAAEQGHLSDDPLRNIKYLFVAATTLATRSAIAGGMQHEPAYNASDLYIQKMDLCHSVEQVVELELDMFAFFTNYMANLDKEAVYSKPIVQCIDYIYYHLNEPIHMDDLAAHVGRNASYLSTLFKRETGYTVSGYILERRIEAARNMLLYSEYSYAEISASLAFSSQSYFTQVFKKSTGYSPRKYRTRFFRRYEKMPSIDAGDGPA